MKHWEGSRQNKDMSCFLVMPNVAVDGSGTRYLNRLIVERVDAEYSGTRRQDLQRGP